MSNKPNPSNVKTAGFSDADPLAETGERLEIVRKRLADDIQNKKMEFERFKEETLWRLNALSDRTIDIAREKEKDVEERLAQDREESDSEFGVWKTRLQKRLDDEEFLDALAKDAFDRLLFTE
jgi:gas vesicle protein